MLEKLFTLLDGFNENVVLAVFIIVASIILLWPTSKEMEDLARKKKPKKEPEVDHELIGRIQKQIKEEENQIFLQP